MTARLQFIHSVPGKPDLELLLPPLSTIEELDEIETLFRIILRGQRRAIEAAHTGAPGNSRAIRDEDDHSSR